MLSKQIQKLETEIKDIKQETILLRYQMDTLQNKYHESERKLKEKRL